MDLIRREFDCASSFGHFDFLGCWILQQLSALHAFLFCTEHVHMVEAGDRSIASHPDYVCGAILNRFEIDYISMRKGTELSINW